MAMSWQKVIQVLDNMYNNKELAEKIGNENAHEDYMLIKEMSMAVGDEAKDVFDKELEEEKYKLGNYKLIHEDTDMIIWKQIGTYNGNKQIIRSSVCFLKTERFGEKLIKQEKQIRAKYYKRGGLIMVKETAVEIIDIYTHKVEKRLDRLGTYLVFIVIPLLLIIAMQLGALIIYLFSSS